MLYFVAPGLLGAVLVIAFVVTSAGNGWCLWRSIRHGERHSLVPLVGGACGAMGLLLLGRPLTAAAPLGILAVPFLLDVGTPALILGSVSALYRSVLRK